MAHAAPRAAERLEAGGWDMSRIVVDGQDRERVAVPAGESTHGPHRRPPGGDPRPGPRRRGGRGRGGDVTWRPPHVGRAEAGGDADAG